MDVKGWVPIFPTTLYNVVQREGVASSSRIGYVEVRGDVVMVDPYKDLPLTAIYHRVVLNGQHHVRLIQT